MEEKKGFNINQLWIVLVLNEDHSHRCWPLKRGWAVIASLGVDLRLACRNAERERERERENKG